MGRVNLRLRLEVVYACPGEQQLLVVIEKSLVGDNDTDFFIYLQQFKEL